ncbi:MAG: hypothetical protein ACR2OW_05345, partial [Methyloligellaceae bacterium]
TLAPQLRKVDAGLIANVEIATCKTIHKSLLFMPEIGVLRFGMENNRTPQNILESVNMVLRVTTLLPAVSWSLNRFLL